MGLGVAAEVTGDVGAGDRVGLAEEIVAEAGLAVGVLAGDLGERRLGAGADLPGLHAQQGGEVPVALPTLQQQLQHHPLLLAQGHGRTAYALRFAGV